MIIISLQLPEESNLRHFELGIDCARQLNFSATLFIMHNFNHFCNGQLKEISTFSEDSTADNKKPFKKEGRFALFSIPWSVRPRTEQVCS